MWLLVDIGNSHTVFALSDGQELNLKFRLRSESHITADELRIQLYTLLNSVQLNLSDVKKVFVASVVPALNQAWAEVFEKAYVEFLNHKSDWDFNIMVKSPEQVGADRLTNAQAVLPSRKNTVVVDLGTACTFDVVEWEGDRAIYLGGLIVPGMMTSLESLLKRASKLYSIELFDNIEAFVKESCIGKNTEEALRKGLLLGFRAQVRSLFEEISNERHWKSEETQLILTGGMSTSVGPLFKEKIIIDPWLTLKGVLAMAEKQIFKSEHENVNYC